MKGGGGGGEGRGHKIESEVVSCIKLTGTDSR